MHTLAFFGLPGQMELIIFLVIVLIFFGKRLPNAMFSVGKSITEFKKGIGDESSATESQPADETSQAAAPKAE